MRNTEETSRHAAPTIDQIVSAGTPLIIRKMNPGLPYPPGQAGDSALLNELSDLIGAKSVLAMAGFNEDGGLLSYSDASFASSGRNTLSGSCRMDKFVRQALELSRSDSSEYLYCQLMNIEATAPELLPIIERFRGAMPSGTNDPIWNMWLGSGKHHVNTHYDKAENLYYVLEGRKTFEIFPPQCLPYLYSGPFEGGPSGVPESIVNSKNPDISKYPRYAESIKLGQVATLLPGDMLYLPAHWWHNVKSEGLNISVNLWWNDIGRVDMLRSELSFLHLLSSIKPLPRNWREFWRVNIMYFVFEIDGDPLSHLPSEKQGIAGESHEGVLLEIRERIRELEGYIHQLELTFDLSDTRLKLCCADQLNFVVRSNDKIEIRLGSRTVVIDDYCAVDILRAFADPRAPLQIYDGAVAKAYSPDSFAKKLVEFIRWGLLCVRYD